MDQAEICPSSGDSRETLSVPVSSVSILMRSMDDEWSEEWLHPLDVGPESSPALLSSSIVVTSGEARTAAAVATAAAAAAAAAADASVPDAPIAPSSASNDRWLEHRRDGQRACRGRGVYTAVSQGDGCEEIKEERPMIEEAAPVAAAVATSVAAAASASHGWRACSVTREVNEACKEGECACKAAVEKGSLVREAAPVAAAATASAAAAFGPQFHCPKDGQRSCRMTREEDTAVQAGGAAFGAGVEEGWMGEESAPPIIACPSTAAMPFTLRDDNASLATLPLHNTSAAIQPTEACCRICLSSEDETSDDDGSTATRNGLISPCVCKGTQQYVHRSCLDEWRAAKGAFAFTHCSTCHAAFHLKFPDRRRTPPGFRGFGRRTWRLSAAAAMFFLVQMLAMTWGYLLSQTSEFHTFRTWHLHFNVRRGLFCYCVGIWEVLFVIVVSHNRFARHLDHWFWRGSYFGATSVLQYTLFPLAMEGVFQACDAMHRATSIAAAVTPAAAASTTVASAAAAATAAEAAGALVAVTAETSAANPSATAAVTPAVLPQLFEVPTWLSMTSYAPLTDPTAQAAAVAQAASTAAQTAGQFAANIAAQAAAEAAGLGSLGAAESAGAAAAAAAVVSPDLSAFAPVAAVCEQLGLLRSVWVGAACGLYVVGIGLSVALGVLLGSYAGYTLLGALEEPYFAELPIDWVKEYEVVDMKGSYTPPRYSLSELQHLSTLSHG